MFTTQGQLGDCALKMILDKNEIDVQCFHDSQREFGCWSKKIKNMDGHVSKRQVVKTINEISLRGISQTFLLILLLGIKFRVRNGKQIYT